MQRAAAARRHLLFCQNLGGQLPPLPTFIDAPIDKSKLILYLRVINSITHLTFGRFSNFEIKSVTVKKIPETVVKHYCVRYLFNCNSLYSVRTTVGNEESE